jgi:midasin (ATPase involved in ribosome maturation)
MRSVAKFSFISQRVFIYLIFEGFCGEDDKEDEKNQKEQDEDDDRYFENDGMGMGDGKGGKENVSKEIEHEEQLEGLKNYESDQEKPEDQKDEEKNEKEEE